MPKPSRRKQITNYMKHLKQTIKKTILVVTFLFGVMNANAQNVYIPDANFKAALVSNQYINTNGDGEIQVSEALAWHYGLDVYNRGISDLTGIEAFHNIPELRCGNNNLYSIDVSHNTSLTLLFCYSNHLSYIDLSQNILLQSFCCNDNPISSLDLSHNPLQNLQCINNNLSSLDVSLNTSLSVLYCGNNPLGSLNVSHNFALTDLDCRYDNLSSLDLSNNIYLQSLCCYHNNLTCLDLSHNSSLEALLCSSNLLSIIDVSSNPLLGLLYCDDNQPLNRLNLANGNNHNMNSNALQAFDNFNLTCIQVDDVNYSNANWSNDKDYVASFSLDCRCTWTPATPVITANGPTTFCTGGSVSLGASNYSAYSWSTGGTIESITTFTTGTYCVTATDFNGCSGVGCIDIIVNTPPVPNIMSEFSTTFCEGGYDIIFIDTLFYQHSTLWSTGDAGDYLYVYTSGNYCATVTDVNGCTGVYCIDINVYPTPVPQITSDGPTTFCPGSSVNLDAGQWSSYYWNTGATTETINVNWFGSYCVIVSNDYGCTSNLTCDTINVYAPPTPSITYSAPTAFCDGSVTLNAGTWSSYDWNTGDVTESIEVSIPDIYCVTITDGNGCNASACLDANSQILSSPIIIANGPTTFCDGGSVILDAGNYSSFAWGTGETTVTISVMESGTYCVTATDANGCTGVNCINVNVIPPPTPVIISGYGTTFCNYGYAYLYLNNYYWNYQWSDGYNTWYGNYIWDNIYSNTSFTVTVTDNNGCTGTGSIDLIVNPSPVPTITASANNVCDGNPVTLDGGTGYSSYNWYCSGYGYSETILAYAEGDYCLQVTDANGCNGSNSIHIYGQPSVIIEQSNSTDLCNGPARSLVANQNQSGFTYLWSSGETTQLINVYAIGDYTVTATYTVSGCTATSTYKVDSVGLFLTINGSTPYCQGNYIYLNVWGNYASLLWSDNTTNWFDMVYSSGTYCVTATDFNGCTATACIDMTIIPFTQPVIQTTGNLCDGGSENLDATGQPYATYYWSTGETTETIVVTYGGNYWVNVTNAEGCSGGTSIQVYSSPSVYISQGDQSDLCNGTTSTLYANASEYSQVFLWSTGETTQSIAIATPGDYSVTITGYYSGCTATATITVTSVGIAVIPNGSTTFCSSNGLYLTTNVPNYWYFIYSWSNGSQGNGTWVNASGTYCVTISSYYSGCTATTCIDVTALPIDSPVIAVVAGECGVSQTLDATGGSYDSYLWSTGETTETIIITTSNNYYVTVTASNGCTASGYIMTNPVPNVTIWQNPSSNICNPTTTLFAFDSTFNSTYLWSTGETTQSITVSSIGDYTVTITDVVGCTRTASTSVSSIGFAIVPNGSTTFCINNGLYLSSNLPNYWNFFYTWSNGSQSANIWVNTSGTYCVTVSDTLTGCSATTCIDVVAMPFTQPVITPSGPTAFCNGGSIDLDAGSYTSYLWNTGETTESITVSSAGTYTVTVSDANGCTGTTSQDLNVYGAPGLSEGTMCFQVGEGGVVYMNAPANTVFTSIDFASYGLPDGDCQNGFTLGWCHAPNSMAVVTALALNRNSAVITADVNTFGGDPCYGYYKRLYIKATYGAHLITANGPTTFCEGGSVTLAAGNYNSYLWSNGETTQSIIATTSGTYIVTVEDFNGCTGTESIDVTVYPNPTPVITSTGPTDLALCYGDHINFTLDAGSGYVAYDWYTWYNSSTQTITPNQDWSGTYSVQVTDANGCIGSSLLNVNIINVPPIAAVITPIGSSAICSGASVSLDAGPWASYAWSNGSIDEILNDSPQANTTYCVTVTDYNGCTGFTCIDVTVNPNPTPVISPNGPSIFCAGGSVTLDAGQWSSYHWNVANGYTEVITATISGNYNVMVSDANGCTGYAAIDVTVLASPNPVISGPSAACVNSSITLDAGVWSSYSWSNGTSSQTTSVGTTGNYCVTVSNAGGCTASICRNITFNANPVPAISGPISNCTGGTITLTTGSASTYHWSTGSNMQVINVSSSGTYAVTVTNASGCTGTASQTVSITNFINPVITETPANPCSGGSALLATTLNYGSYSWNNGATTATTSVITPGIYYVTVTSGNCSGVAHYTVAFAAAPVPNILAANLANLCGGGSATLTVGAVFAAYNWSSGATSQSIAINNAGTYSVTVTSSNGCTGTASIVVSSGCVTPTNLATSNITATTAYISWVQPNCYYGYSIRISKHNANVWTTYVINPNTHYTFSGLSRNTAYDWQIRTNCNAAQTSTSPWSAIQQFSTPLRLEGETDRSLTDFNAYPNPASDHLTVDFSSETIESYSIRMMDMLGQVMISTENTALVGNNQCQMNLQGIARGIYILSLQKGEATMIKKIVVQ